MPPRRPKKIENNSSEELLVSSEPVIIDTNEDLLQGNFIDPLEPLASLDSIEVPEPSSVLEENFEIPQDRDRRDKIVITDLTPIYYVRNGKVKQIKKEDVKKTDYILVHDEIIIVDGDKSVIRPYVHDLLEKIGIETLVSQRQKKTLFLIFLLIMVNIISIIMIIAISGSVDEIKSTTLTKDLFKEEFGKYAAQTRLINSTGGTFINNIK